MNLKIKVEGKLGGTVEITAQLLTIIGSSPKPLTGLGFFELISEDLGKSLRKPM